LGIKNFKFCVRQIINYVQKKVYIEDGNLYNCNTNKYNYLNELKYLDYFIEYIVKIYFEHKKNKYKKYIINIFNGVKYIYNSDDDVIYLRIDQLFIEYLIFNYYKYLGKKYAPDPPGQGYIKTKKHFGSIINKK
jgi:hypothetical protein